MWDKVVVTNIILNNAKEILIRPHDQPVTITGDVEEIRIEGKGMVSIDKFHEAKNIIPCNIT
jgi:hypothetical protein